MGQATWLIKGWSVIPIKPSGRSAGGEESKEFKRGAQLCDSSNGSTFAWVVQYGVAWIQ